MREDVPLCEEDTPPLSSDDEGSGYKSGSGASTSKQLAGRLTGDTVKRFSTVTDTIYESLVHSHDI